MAEPAKVCILLPAAHSYIIQARARTLIKLGEQIDMQHLSGRQSKNFLIPNRDEMCAKSVLFNENIVNQADAFPQQGDVLSTLLDRPNVPKLRLSAGSRPPEAPDFRGDFQAQAERLRERAMLTRPEHFKLLPLKSAAPIWLQEKKLHIKKARTFEAYQLYIRNLIRHFGEEQLCAIHIGHILTYQQVRSGEGACASYINHETNTLAQILKRADMWDLLEKHYKPLPTGNWTPPKVLSPEDEERFFRIAATKPSWSLAYWACSLTNNTSAVGTELRNLQLKHVFLEHSPPKFHIPDDKVKNEFRARVIPLNEVAEKQLRRIVERAKGLGACKPEHYIFPKRIKRNGWDVTQPGSRSFIRKAFEDMREAMGEGFEWLCPRNFRNQLITKLFEGGEPDETITSIAGHQSIKMSRYYSRIRIDRKFEALSAIVPKKKGAKNAG